MWREASEADIADTESEIGQLMLYLIAAHFRRFSVINPLIMNDAFWRHPTLMQLPGEFPIEDRFFLA